ncbi:MAG: manganese/iron transport system permease protein [Oceanospirillaceae bacterium]|jgi:manganese/iron transport system permease protein
MFDMHVLFDRFLESVILQNLLLPFEFEFMQLAFLAVTIISFPMAILSCYIVLKGWSLMGDAIAHAVLPGIVLAYILMIPLSIGAFTAGLCCAISTRFVKQNSKLREDTVMGIVFSGMFAVGIIMFHETETDLHLTHLLFGDVLGITIASLIETTLITLAILIVFCIKGRDLLLLIFDQKQAQATGISVRFWHYAIPVMLALAIVAALQAVGMILSIALLITPGACAVLVTKRFSSMIKVASTVALGASLTGTYSSFYFDSAPAATIVLFMSATFVLCFLYKQCNYRYLKTIKNE